jgi:hypothetical protein
MDRAPDEHAEAREDQDHAGDAAGTQGLIENQDPEQDREHRVEPLDRRTPDCTDALNGRVQEDTADHHGKHTRQREPQDRGQADGREIVVNAECEPDDGR